MDAVDHTLLPYDELIEIRIRPGDYDDRLACRVMEDGYEIGVWIDAHWDGVSPVAQKILAVNDLLAACYAAEKALRDIPNRDKTEAQQAAWPLLKAAIAKAEDRL